MTRKEFFHQCLNLSVTASCATLILSEGCTSVRSVDAMIIDNRIVLAKKEFDQEPQLIVRRVPGFKAPLYVAKLDDSHYSAVLMYCTHKGCELRAEGMRLACPCHGSEFSPQGKVLSSPAKEDLRSFDVRTDESSVFIQL